MHSLSLNSITKEFGVDKNKGLNEEQVVKLRAKFGRNEITPKKPKSFIKRLIEALSEPTLVILEFAWVITVGVNVGKYLKTGKGDFLECVGILFAVILSASLTLIMEGKSQKAFEMLGKVYDRISVKVVRGGEVTVIPKEEVVCGDIIKLESGNKIIADGRLINCNSLMVDESMLTGESQQVEKSANITLDKSVPLAERKNMVYSGTFVSGGSGEMIVTAVGDRAQLGEIASKLGSKGSDDAPLNQKLNKLGKTVTVIGGISAMIVFILSIVRVSVLGNLNFFTVQDAFLESIVLIVAAVPEGLPATAAISLTLNVVKLAKSNALIRKLVAAETAGCVSIICSDKTGTLTQNEMTVERVICPNCECENSLLTNIKYNSTARLKREKGRVKVFGSATEGALLKWLDKIKQSGKEKVDNRLIGRVLPFNSSKKYMATELLDGVVLYKGAPEIIIEDSALTEWEKSKILREIEGFQSNGKRVIAFSSFSGKWTGELTGGKARYDGFAVITDPVRKDVFKAVETCENAGIKVMMMTGDNLQTATSIARELNILTPSERAVTASYVDGLTFSRLVEEIEDIKVVARSTPATKLKIVEALKKRGEVVAVTGDGVNDAPAIESADLGIAMGSGSEITKEASDVVLLDDSFSTIVKAVSFGRNIYKNFQRFITFQLTVNLTAMIVVIVSLALGLENPFTSVQLLWIDIIMDGPPALTLAMEGDKGKFMNAKPVNREDGIVTFTMLVRIIFQGVFASAVIIFEYLYDFIGVGVGGITTAIFCMFVIFQLLNAFNCRKIGSESIFSGIGDNKIMLVTFGATFLFQIIITQFLCGFFGTTPLTLTVWLKIIGVCLFSVIFSEIYKFIYRIFKSTKKLSVKRVKT